MNHRHEYFLVKAHIDDLVRAAERSRMAAGMRPRTPIGIGRGLVDRLRRVRRRLRALTGSEVCVECP